MLKYKMVLYKLNPITFSLCHQISIKKFCNHEKVPLNLLRKNYSERKFTLGVKKPKLSLQGSKSQKPFKSQKSLGGAEELGNVPVTPFSPNLLLKPFLFTVAFSTASIAGSAIWQYENVRQKALLLMQKSWLSEKWWKYEKKKFVWREEFNKMWNRLSEGEKLFVPICFVNVLIYLAWKVRRFQPTMIKYFCSSPFGHAVCWPMVLTTFSHYNIFHLAANMYVLHSFSRGGVEILGKEQFLGLYLASGAVSSFTSYMYKALRSQPSLSLGASGAIMAMVAYTCAKYPDMKLSIILVPWFTFSAGTGIKALMALDFTGVLLGWTFFDHAAHLGGALCGLGWCFWGNTYIWQKREPFLHWWHELRSPSK